MKFSSFLDKLDVVNTADGQYMARCPSPKHPDTTPSLSVTCTKERILVNCFGGCSALDICAGMDLKVSDLFIKPEEQEQAYDVNFAELSKERFLLTKDLYRNYLSEAKQHPSIFKRVQELRGWNPKTLHKLYIGYNKRLGRLTIPVIDEKSELIGCKYYLPAPRIREGREEKKVFQERGSTPYLFPSPATVQKMVQGSLSKTLWVVEGEPDAISAIDIGLSAVALPGTNEKSIGLLDLVLDDVEQVIIFSDPKEQERAHAKNVYKVLSERLDTRLFFAPGKDLNDLLRALTVPLTTL